MGKKRIIDLLAISIEDKLESNGALRNVAVNDAWKRLRQNIDVKSWKVAESVLQELSNSLQKINMLKSMTGLFSKLRQAFQNPEQMAEESDYITKETPREPPTSVRAESPGQAKPKEPDTSSETKALKDEISTLKDTLQQVRTKIETENTVPDQIDIPKGVSNDTKTCFQTIIVVCDKCKKWTRDLEHTKKRLENSETRNKDLEKQMDEKEEKLDKLTSAVDALEKKHNNMKEEKMESFKDQMKFKSLERQVELKTAELTKIKEENRDFKDRLNTLTSSKSSESSDLLNPFPPAKLAEKYADLYNKEWKDAFNYYKSTLKMSEVDAAKRTLDILQDSFNFCAEISDSHLQRVASEFLCPGDPSGSSQSLTRLGEAEIKQIQSLRKQTCKASCEVAKSSFIMALEGGNEEKYTFQEITDNMGYIEKCVEICWFLVVQTPPLHINFTDLPAPNKDIDKEKYEISSGKGSKVKYVLLPPLYAWKDGDLLRKGFVEAK